MKNILLLILLLIIYDFSIAQCNCEKISRDDGTIVTQCMPLPISSDNSSQIGIAVASNGSEKFLALVIRFKEVAWNVNSSITILLSNNNMLSVELISSTPSYIGNSQVTNAIFSINSKNESLLKLSTIKTISFKSSDNLLHTYTITMNSDIVKKQLDCL